jgi:ribonuclease D
MMMMMAWRRRSSERTTRGMDHTSVIKNNENSKVVRVSPLEEKSVDSNKNTTSKQERRNGVLSGPIDDDGAANRSTKPS